MVNLLYTQQKLELRYLLKIVDQFRPNLVEQLQIKLPSEARMFLHIFAVLIIQPVGLTQESKAN